MTTLKDLKRLFKFRVGKGWSGSSPTSLPGGYTLYFIRVVLPVPRKPRPWPLGYIYIDIEPEDTLK